MIERHRGRMEISRRVLEQKPPSAAAEVARAAIERLSRKLGALRGWQRKGRPDEESALAYRPTIERMHDGI